MSDQVCKVSVIVPVYNTEKYLRNCLESLAAQTLDDMEVVVVNDGSTDGSLAIAEEFAARYDWFHVFSTENRGVSHARNYGAKMSRGGIWPSWTVTTRWSRITARPCMKKRSGTTTMWSCAGWITSSTAEVR